MLAATAALLPNELSLGNFEADPAELHKLAQWRAGVQFAKGTVSADCCSPDPLFPLTSLARELVLFNVGEAEQHTKCCVFAVSKLRK